VYALIDDRKSGKKVQRVEGLEEVNMKLVFNTIATIGNWGLAGFPQPLVKSPALTPSL